MCLFGAVDNRGETVDFYFLETPDRAVAKLFRAAFTGQSRQLSAHVLPADVNRSSPAAIQELKTEQAITDQCRHRCQHRKIDSDVRQPGAGEFAGRVGPDPRGIHWLSTPARGRLRESRMREIGTYSLSVGRRPARKCTSSARI
ncbi:MAG: DDE-type integrase/transposase/recombinase [Acidobacteriia bacterium]|nr:DDE-type integrase/transposase/recombinase [Terriglobia bacterium]